MALLHCNFQVYQSTARTLMSFCTPLHFRGTDFNVYRNTWDASGGGIVFQADDSPLFRALVVYLMGDGTGVNLIEVKNYRIAINHSHAVSGQAIVDGVKQALRNAGYEPVEELCTNVMPMVTRAENALLNHLGITWLRGRIAARVGCKPIRAKRIERAVVFVKKASSRGWTATGKFVGKAANRFRRVR